jgi:ribosomal protein S14
VHGNAFEAKTARDRGQRAASSPGVLARPCAQRGLRHDEQRRLELVRQRVRAAAADGEHPIGVERAAGREQGQQGVDADGGHVATINLARVGQTRARG